VINENRRTEKKNPNRRCKEQKKETALAQFLNAFFDEIGIEWVVGTNE
jgi:hypothetical protein